MAQVLCCAVQACCREHINYIPYSSRETSGIAAPMFSLPAFTRRFVEDFTVLESLGLHVEVDLAKPYVVSEEAISLDVMYPRIQRNIIYYDTFAARYAA